MTSDHEGNRAVLRTGSRTDGEPRHRPTWIPVATALLRRRDTVLLGLRPEDRELKDVWEFPGGKIEMGESPEQALNRELSEELGIEAEIGALKLAATHNYSGTGILLLFFEVCYWKGEVKPIHHLELKWVATADLSAQKLPDANLKILPRILRALASPGGGANG